MSLVPKLRDLKLIHLVLYGLLAVHTAWIFVHISLVKEEQINPWKLGGYGMYTKPSEKLRVRFYDTQTRQQIKAVHLGTLKTFTELNSRLVFRCKPVNSQSIRRLVEDNIHLKNKPISMVIWKRAFEKNPIRAEFQRQWVIQFNWLKPNELSYVGVVCGRRFGNTIKLDS